MPTKSFLLLFAVVSIFKTTLCTQLTCNIPYDPSSYTGNTLVPSSCKQVPGDLTCPPSWKSGVIDVDSTLIDANFVLCHEGFLKCGYVPIDSSTGMVLGTSGVTIGGGVDLGSKNSAYFSNIGISASIINMLEPYFGLTQSNAACVAIESPLSLTKAQAESLTEAVKNFLAIEVENGYNSDRQANTLPFRSLHRGIRTAVADVCFQFGSSSAFSILWGHVITNNWEEAVKELRNFYPNPGAQAQGDLTRRNNEADILEAALQKCERSADIVFLLDESGSIDPSDYQLGLNFILNMTKAFSDETLADPRGTRFGLSIFSTNYRYVFYLSAYQSQSAYATAISGVTQISLSTNLGSALSQITTQFTEAKGLRPVNYGFPKVLIVLTDGKSGDSVSAPAASLRADNIVIFSIGIGSYDLDQLKAVASSTSHVFLLENFVDLDSFVETLSASACNQPQPVSVGVTINGEVTKDKFQYYEFVILVSVNLRLSCDDTKGNSLIYVSRTNPHPYEHDHDFGFTSAQTNKEIIISPTVPTLTTRRRRAANDTGTIYVSVKGTSDNVTYTLVGMECDPAMCMEGTNEVVVETTSVPTTSVPTASGDHLHAPFHFCSSLLLLYYFPKFTVNP